MERSHCYGIRMGESVDRRAGLLPPGGDRHPPAQGISIER